MIISQETTAACTAFSTTYYALSMIYNMKFNIVSTEGKMAHSFDPWFTYSMLNKGSCSTGLYISDALTLLQEKGAKKLLYPPYSLDCDKSWGTYELQNLNKLIAPYEISKYQFDEVLETTDIINSIKTEISLYKYPVVSEWWDYTDESLYDVGNDGIWHPIYKQGEGGHAMTIVGYDDYINGGSFRVVNSWAADWGDNGYMWVKYSDFKRYSTYAYYMWTYSNIQNEFPQIRDISGYSRVKTTTGKIYEGQVSSNKSFTGYGILSNTEKDLYFIGNFVDGVKDGHFKIVDQGEFWYSNYINGERVSDDDLGFAGDSETLEKTELTKDYLSKLFPSAKVGEFDDIDGDQ